MQRSKKATQRRLLLKLESISEGGWLRFSDIATYNQCRCGNEVTTRIRLGANLGELIEDDLWWGQCLKVTR